MSQNYNKLTDIKVNKPVDISISDNNIWPDMSLNYQPPLQYICSNDNFVSIPQNKVFIGQNFGNFGSSDMIGLSQPDHLASPNYLKGYNSNIDLTSGLNSPGSFGDSFNMIFPSSNNQNFACGQSDPTSSVQNFVINSSASNSVPLLFSNSTFINNCSTDFKMPDQSLNQSTQIIPSLISMLSSIKTDEVVKAAYMLYHLVKSDKTRTPVYENNNAIPAVIKTMRDNISNGSILRSCSAFVYYISSNNKNALKVIYQSDIFSILDQLLELGVDGVLYYTISTIHSIFLSVNESREFLGNNVHLSKFVKLLSHKNDKFLAIITDCICICIKNIDTNFMIQSTEAAQHLVAALEGRTYEKLLFNTCRLLKEVSSSNNSKKTIIKNGAINHLTKLLLNISRRVAVNALLTIRNLSDLANSEKDMEELMNILVRFVINQTSSVYSHKENDPGPTKLEEQLVGSSLGILANLTCNNPENKIYLIKRNLIPILANICQVIESKDILESALSSLRNLTCRNNKSEEACEQFVKVNGIKILINLIQKYMLIPLKDSSYIKKVSFGLFPNFVWKKDYIAMFRDYKVTQLTAHTLAAVMEEIKQASINNPPSNIRGYNWKIHLHNCNKLLETCVSVLHLMATDEASLQLMISSSVLIGLCSKLLLANSSNLVSLVISFLFDLSKTSNGLMSIETAFITTHQNEISCLNSNSGNICIDRLREISLKSQKDSPIVQTVNLFLIRLNNTQLSKYIRLSVPSFDELSTNVDLNIHSLLNNDLNGILDSPTLTRSPCISQIFDQF